MSYLTEEQEKALNTSATELKALPADVRQNMLFHHHDLKIRKQEALWATLQNFMLVGIPFLAFLGIMKKK